MNDNCSKPCRLLYHSGTLTSVCTRGKPFTSQLGSCLAAGPRQLQKQQHTDMALWFCIRQTQLLRVLYDLTGAEALSYLRMKLIPFTQHVDEGQYLVAGDSLRMLIVFPEHVSKPSPGWGICIVDAQSLAVALLSCLPPNLPLCSPQISQVVVHIDLYTTQDHMCKVNRDYANQR